MLFMNFRADRARQLSQSLIESGFSGFSRRMAPNINLVTTTEYASTLICPVAFPPDTLEDSLERCWLKWADATAHRRDRKVCPRYFFFSGGREDAFPGETRTLIPSPDVATYDLQPEMSAREVTDSLVDAIAAGQYDFIVVNFANGDMVGHTGQFALPYPQWKYWMSASAGSRLHCSPTVVRGSLPLITAIVNKCGTTTTTSRTPSTPPSTCH